MKKNLKRAAFFFCYAVLLIDLTFRYAYGIGDITHTILNYVVMPLLCFLIVDNLNGLSLKRAVWLLLILAAAVSTRIISNDNLIMLGTFFICAFKGISLDSLIKFSIPIRIISLIVLIILFNLGLTEAETYTRVDGVIRYAYGFGNINNFSTYILSIVLQFVYLDRKKFRLRDVLAILVGLLTIVIMTASRTHVGILSLLLVVVVVPFFRSKARRIEIKNKLLKFCIVHSFLIMTLLSLLAYVGYINGNSFAKEIDLATSKRISTVKTLVDMNGVAPFGQEIDRSTAGGGHRVLDNSYAYILLYFGPLTMTAVAHLYKLGIQSFFRKKDDTGAVFISLYNIAGLMEHFSVEVSMNIFLLNFSNLIYDTSEVRKIGGKNEKK